LDAVLRKISADIDTNIVLDVCGKLSSEVCPKILDIPCTHSR